MSDLGTPRDQTLMTVGALVGNEPRDSKVEVTWRTPHGTTGRCLHPAGRFWNVVELILSVGASGLVWVRLVDRDGQPVPRVWILQAVALTRREKRALERLDVGPSVLVTRDDDSLVAMWPLSAPLTPPRARQAQRRLAGAIGADTANIPPVGRIVPAGISGHECVRLEVDVFTARRLVGHLPDPDPPPQSREAANARRRCPAHC